MSSCLNDDPFEACKRAGGHPNSVTFTIVGLARDEPWLANCQTYPLDLILRNEHRLPAELHKPDDARCLKDLDFAAEIRSYEEVTAKERLLHDLLSIAPGVLLLDQWEKGFDPTIEKTHVRLLLEPGSQHQSIPQGMRIDPEDVVGHWEDVFYRAMYTAMMRAMMQNRTRTPGGTSPFRKSVQPKLSAQASCPHESQRTR